MVMGTAWKAVGSGEQLGCGSIPHFSAMWLWSKCLGHKARGLKPPDVGSNPTSYTKPKNVSLWKMNRTSVPGLPRKQNDPSMRGVGVQILLLPPLESKLDRV